jgi:outer membrane autotransporter protein
VGNWRQRLGVIDRISKHGLGLWARMFQDRGTIEPSHEAGNFGQGGQFAFDQRNTGTEVGLDFAVADGFSAGLLLAKADARQQLTGGMGVSKLTGDTRGVYGTWVSPAGFYVDGSYRWMDFDVRLDSAAGEMRGGGQADAWNLEAGYAWTLGGGLTLEPQLQYTRTQVEDIDTLSGALSDFRSTGGDASTGRLGVAVRKGFAVGRATWTPYASVNAVREFDGRNGYAINDTFFGATSTEGTSLLVQGGLDIRSGNLSVYGGVNWQDGGTLHSFVGGQMGLRYSW